MTVRLPRKSLATVGSASGTAMTNTLAVHRGELFKGDGWRSKGYDPCRRATGPTSRGAQFRSSGLSHWYIQYVL